jgi:ATP-dependent Clp endopeptidase proteolytic subunit ClpP
MKWYKIVNKVEHTDVYIYDEIGFWGTRASDFVKEIRQIKNDIILHINSPGGQVFDGLAIYNSLKAHTSKVTTKIEGIAASMASIIALAGETIEMAENSMFMIHNPLVNVTGDSEELRKNAELLDRIKEQIVNIYVSHSNLSADEIGSLMDQETWLTAKEAKEKGFINSIVDNVVVSNNFGHQFEGKQEYQEWIKNNKREENMEELFEVLGVKDKAEAVVKIDSLTTEVTALRTKNQKLETEVKDLRKINIEAKINQAISEGKITPAQKDFATTLINKDEALFDEFVKNAGNSKSDLTKTITLGANADEELTWEVLIQDPEKAGELYNTNPKLYEELRNKYLEDNR